MNELKLAVPTYNYQLFPNQVDEGAIPEFGVPHVPVLIREADGVRIVLGTHDYGDLERPDIQIERQPQGWMIFLHPCPGGDASGYVYFLDDGRSFLVKEVNAGPTEPIEVLGAMHVFRKFTELKRDRRKGRKNVLDAVK
jgi:hypothetical protein